MSNQIYSRAEHIEQKFFNPNYLAVPIIEKQNYSGFVNLSSNQLEHSEYKFLFEQFLNEIKHDSVREYAYLKPILKKIADCLEINVEHMLFSAGSDVSIYYLIDLLGKNSKKIIIQSPTYRAYYDYAILKGIPTTEVEFLKKDQNEFTQLLCEEYLANQTDAFVVLTNPNNFTGEYLSENNLIKIINLCAQNNHIVIIDESYVDFGQLQHDKIYHSYEHVIFVKTLSKSYGLAGARLGITYSKNKAIIDYLKRSGIEKTTSIVSITFYQYLLENRSHLQKLIDELNEAKTVFMQRVQEACPSYFVYPSATNFTTTDLGSVQQASKTNQYLRENGFLIKHLHIGDKPTSLIRVTSSEKNILQKVAELIIQSQVIEAL